ncbi:MAG: ferrous iron transport protein B [bacterium]
MSDIKLFMTGHPSPAHDEKSRLSPKIGEAPLRYSHGKTITVALAGNPNSGKTSIFNNLTGGRQKVGNWAGVTVTKKEGNLKYKGYQIKVVDLPGIYSLTAYSIEEIVARNYIVNEKPDIIVNVVDAANLERNLYLSTQFIELGARMVISLNMVDTAQGQGIEVDKHKLGRLIGVPLVETVGSKNQGTFELLDEVLAVYQHDDPVSRHIHINYGQDIEEEIHKIQGEIRQHPELPEKYSTRWLSVKLLEKDPKILELLEENRSHYPNVISQSEKSRTYLENIYKENLEEVITDRRYGFIAGACQEAVRFTRQDRLTLSEKADRVITNRWLGFPLFILAMWLMFRLTFGIGDIPKGWLETFFSWSSLTVRQVMSPGLLRDLIVDGLISGVGSIISFLPEIFMIFLCISFMEDTGYMARAAFIMDRVMHTLGLHGKSFIPLLMGFGCNVPAIMGTRTLESRRDRILTILLIPYMNCSARLTVFVLLTGAFFPNNAGNVIFLLYMTGILFSILSGQLFKKLFFKGETAPFVMELPPYRLPSVKSLVIHMWNKGVIFIKKVWKVVLYGSILIWFLSAFPQQVNYSVDYGSLINRVERKYEKIDPGDRTLAARKAMEISKIENLRSEEHMEKSFLGRVGRLFEPLISPLGFSWKEGVALISGFIAKEIVVSSMGVLYRVGSQVTEESKSLVAAVRGSHMTRLSAFCLMLFIMLYVPCLATIGAITKETGSRKWTYFSILYSLTSTWLLVFVIYRTGRLFGL